jgi:hypothetical protein
LFQRETGAVLIAVVADLTPKRRLPLDISPLLVQNIIACPWRQATRHMESIFKMRVVGVVESPIWRRVCVVSESSARRGYLESIISVPKCACVDKHCAETWIYSISLLYLSLFLCKIFVVRFR